MITKAVESRPAKNADHGEFQVNTSRNSYWVKVNHGYVVDTPPALKEFIKQKIGILLSLVYKYEGRYEIREIIRCSTTC